MFHPPHPPRRPFASPLPQWCLDFAVAPVPSNTLVPLFITLESSTGDLAIF